MAIQTVRAGWAKVRENGPSKGDGSEEEVSARRQLLLAAEEEAKTAKKGLWSSTEQVERLVEHGMPEDPTSFLAKWKGKPIDGLCFSL